jgi:RNA processing factor Prp31
MACNVDSIGAYRALVRRLRQRHHFEDLGIYGRIILK